MVFVYKKLAQFAVRGALPPRRSESPVCATVNKPSCLLHLLGSFIGSRGFSSLEQRPEFWVLQYVLQRRIFVQENLFYHAQALQRSLQWALMIALPVPLTPPPTTTKSPLHLLS